VACGPSLSLSCGRGPAHSLRQLKRTRRPGQTPRDGPLESFIAVPFGEISSSAFEFYEGLRVLISGGVVVGLYSAVASTYARSGDIVSSSPVLALLVSLFVGLLLLFLDLPARAAVSSYDAPVPMIETWEERPSGGASRLNVYYEILDAEVPTGIRNRTHYLGAIYRIGFEAIYFTATSVAVLAIAVAAPTTGPNRNDGSTTVRWLFVAGALSHLTAVGGAVVARHREHARKNRPAWKRLKADLATEIPRADRILLIVAAVLVGACLSGFSRWLSVPGIGLPLLLWAFRYFFGVKRREPSSNEGSNSESSAGVTRLSSRGARQNLHGVSAAVLFGMSAIFVCVCAAVRAPTGSALSPAVALGWIATTLIAAMLLVARGHEKRLLGSYAIQRAWLNQNRDKLVNKGYFVRSE